MSAKNNNALQHLELYIMRLKSLIANAGLKQIIGNEGEFTLESLLNGYGYWNRCHGFIFSAF
jgi:hypothetical protein